MRALTAGIIGGGGYTAGELIRLLYAHPEVSLDFVYSESQSGKLISEVHQDLLFLGDMQFSDEFLETDVLFLCQGHGKAISFLSQYEVSPETVIIDLGNDFRLAAEGWTYGLPEFYRDKIVDSKNIANPGCFATALQLGLLPLAKNKLLNEDIHISAITGSTGAGQSLQRTTHFTWRVGNISAYKVFEHQHEAEIWQTLHHAQPDYAGKIHFVPYRGDFSRGIYATLYTRLSTDITQIENLYKEYYADHPFVQVTNSVISLKSVVNTNQCYLQLSAKNNQLVIHSTIDNLLKGASGQAVQNMNLALKLPETCGLHLKPSAY